MYDYIYIIIVLDLAAVAHTRLWLLANLRIPLRKSHQWPQLRLLCTEIENTASLRIKMGLNGSTCLALLHFKTVIIRGQIRPVLVGFAMDIVAQEHICLSVLGLPLPVSSHQHSTIIFHSSTNDIMGRVAQSV